MNLRELFYSIVPKRDYLIAGRGDSNLIITAPHGGNLKPRHIPSRTQGKLQKDSYSLSLAQEVIHQLNVRPSYVLSEIHRSKVDLNREVVEATEGNPEAIKVYNDWNITIRTYKQLMLQKKGRGLLVDIHSNNDADYIQLGYGISAKSYNRIANGGLASGTTLDSLGGGLRRKMFGPNSIKTSLEYAGYRIPNPVNDAMYFNGGRTIEHFAGYGLGCVQVEVPTYMLKADKYRIALALSFAIEDFLKYEIYD